MFGNNHYYHKQAPQNAKLAYYGGCVPTEAVLRSGEYITSPQGHYYLTMQHDGNLVLYTNPDFQPNNAVWSSKTHGQGQGPYHAKVQADGNFVVYDKNNSPLWASNTYQKGQGPYTLLLQNDRNLVLYDRNHTATWASDTWQAPCHNQQVEASQYHFVYVQHHQNKPKPNAQLLFPLGLLQNETSIRSGEYVASPCENYYLTMQHDGNLVLYTHHDFQPNHAVWSTQTHGKGQGPYRATVQADGNFVVYDRNNQPTWASDTWNKGTGPFRLVVQSDRNVVLYDVNNQATWSSNTYVQVVQPNGKEVHVGGTVYQEHTIGNEQYVKSPNGQYFLKMQQDGNLVLYTNPDFQPNHAVWSTQTNGKGQGPFHAKIQADGNFVVYDRNNQPTWASNTWQKGTAPYRVVLQNDRNLVLYDRNNQATWASGTNV